MSVVTVARRYAEAMVDVAISRNEVESIDNELRVFAEAMNTSRELYDVFASPIVSPTDKLSLLNALIGRLKAGQMTANLLRTMLKHYRLHYVAEVYEQFRRKMNERKGLIVAEVATAVQVGASEQARLGRTLEQITGKQVEFKFNTDPSLIGGVVTRIGSVVYDGSVRTQLQAIKERLKRGDSAI
jgi:F-type H+-transporting ATPase subunit delta